MGSTNYTDTFIQVAEDCRALAAEEPPITEAAPTVAALQYALIAQHPYEFTSDDVVFEVYATRQSLSMADRASARDAFFAKSQACLRSSPLGKRYGWGIHHNAESKIALVPFASAEYDAFVADSTLRQTRALRSKRA